MDKPSTLKRNGAYVGKRSFATRAVSVLMAFTLLFLQFPVTGFADEKQSADTASSAAAGVPAVASEVSQTDSSVQNGGESTSANGADPQPNGSSNTGDGTMSDQVTGGNKGADSSASDADEEAAVSSQNPVQTKSSDNGVPVASKAKKAASKSADEPMLQTDAPTAKLMDYSLADILSNFTTLAFGDLEYRNHNMGGPLCQGTFSGFGTCWDEGSIPTYVAGEYKYTDKMYGRGHIPNQPGTLYVGSGNTVAADKVTVNGIGISWDANKCHAEVYDDYVDWAALEAAVIEETKQLSKAATTVINVENNNQILEIPAGSNVTVNLNGHKNIGYKLTGSGSDIELLRMGTVINILDSGDVNIPLAPGNYPQGEQNDGASVVFNCPNATYVTTDGGANGYSQQIGHILAPNANIDEKIGNYNGCMVGQNITCAGEGHVRTYVASSLILTTPLKDVGGSSEPTTGKLVITKTIKGDVTAEEAEGALKFEVKNNADAASAKTYTLKDFTKVKDGVYTLELEEAAGGYTITETTHDITGKTVTVTYKVGDGAATEGDAATADVAAGQTTNVAFENDYKNTPVSPSSHKVVVSKQDVAGAEIAGAKLTVTDSSNNEVACWTSEAGKSHEISLQAGTYTLTETTAPDGYAKAESITFTVGSDGKVTVGGKEAAKVIMTDAYTSKTVKVSKEGAGGEGVVGAKLTVTKEGKDGTETVASWDTEADENGNAKVHDVTGLEVGVEYTLTETNVPGNYTAAESITFKLDKDGNVLVKGADGTFSKVEDGQLTMVDAYADHDVTVSKCDLGGSEIADANIQLFAGEGVSGAKVDEWVSEAGKSHELKLQPGTYTLHETAAPTGYVVTTDITFKVAVDGTVTVKDTDGNYTAAENAKVVMTDAYEPKTVFVSKENAGGEGVAGATLTITTKDDKGQDKTVDTWETEANDDGTAKIHKVDGLTVGQEYTLTETGVPGNYEAAESIVFKADKDGNVFVKGEGDTFSKVEEGQLTMIDAYASHKVLLSKIDLGGDELAGATLQLTGTELDGDDIEMIEWQSGTEAHQVELKPGTYKLHEAAQPNGYTVATDIEFTVEVDGVVSKVSEHAAVSATDDGVPVIAMTDGYSTRTVAVSKEGAGGEGVVGAKLTITTKDDKGQDKTVDTWETEANDDGTAKVHDVTGLEVGVEYTLTETTAPDGYAKAESITFKLDKDGNVLVKGADGKFSKVESGQLTMVDGYTDHKVTLSKQDIAGDELAGAKLELSGTELGGGAIEKIEWTSDGTAKEFNLKPGTYTMTETATPDDSKYELATAITFTVNVDGSISDVTSSAKVTGEGASTVIAMVDDYTDHKVTLSKQDIGGDELAGAKLELSGTELGGSAIEPIKWESGDKAKELQLKPGTYTMTETAAPDGFALATEITFTVNVDGSISNVSSSAEVSGAGADTVIAMVDELYYEVSICNVDGDGNDLKGAHFKVVDEDGNAVKDAKTGENLEWDYDGKKRTFHLPRGSFRILQVTAPNGYEEVDEVSFSIDEDGTVVDAKGEEVKDDVVPVVNDKVDDESDDKNPGSDDGANDGSDKDANDGANGKVDGSNDDSNDDKASSETTSTSKTVSTSKLAKTGDENGYAVLLLGSLAIVSLISLVGFRMKRNR